MEAMVSSAHHIEVQLIADGQGQAWAAGVRDCSCQRRHQKVVEESSSVLLTREQEEEVKEASRRLALESGYRNAGTVEFLYEPSEKRFSFMEVNARLQVEHPVTEAVTGLDWSSCSCTWPPAASSRARPRRPSATRSRRA